MRERIGRILCAVGLHKWRFTGNTIMLDSGYMCVRPYCRKCRLDTFAGSHTYEREFSMAHDLPAPLAPQKEKP